MLRQLNYAALGTMVSMPVQVVLDVRDCVHKKSFALLVHQKEQLSLNACLMKLMILHVDDHGCALDVMPPKI